MHMLDKDASFSPQALAVSTLPDVRENLDGYALRLAEQNGYPRPSWLREILGMDAAVEGKNTRQPLLSPAGLARLTGSPSSEAFDRLFNTMGVPMPLPGFDVIRRMTRGRPWLCPKCILEDGIQLAIWEVQFCVSCPRHRCRLVEACPVCEKPWRLERDGIDFCGVKGCIGKPSCSPVVAVDEAEAAVSAWLHELWQPMYKDVIRDTGFDRLADLFPTLDLADALALIRFLGATPAEATTVKPDDLMNAPLTAVANCSRYLLEGVDGIRRFLLEMEKHHADRDHGSVLAVFGRHLTLLIAKTASTSSRIRELVLPLVGDIWDAECALRNAPVALSRNQEATRRWVTQRDAVKRLGVSTKDIKKIAVKTAIKTRIVNKRQHKVYLFDVDDVERVARGLNYDMSAGRARSVDGHVTCTKVAARLSTRPAVVAALYEKGLVGRIPCRASYLYSMDDAERLIATLDRVCDEEASSDRVLLPTASDLMGIELATAVRRATHGDLKLVIAYPGRGGLGRYAVPRSELRRTGVDIGAVMSFNQCMSKLVCRRPLIDALIKEKFLLPKLNRSWKGKSDTSLDARSVERFHGKFITGSEVAKILRVSYWNAVQILADSEVVPEFSGSSEHKFYDRSAVQKAISKRATAICHADI